MFTMDNTDGFSQADLDELNEALETLLADVDEDTRDQAEKSYSDLLNNAWCDGMTASELVAAVSK